MVKRPDLGDIGESIWSVPLDFAQARKTPAMRLVFSLCAIPLTVLLMAATFPLLLFEVVIEMAEGPDA